MDHPNSLVPQKNIDLTSPNNSNHYDVIVIGAGLTGAIVAHQLSASKSVLVIEKARGSGGRLSSKRLSGLPQGYENAPQFSSASLGCDEFSLSTQTVHNYLSRLCTDALAMTELDDGYKCAVKGRSSAWTRALIKESSLAFHERVQSVVMHNGIWTVTTECLSEQNISKTYSASHVILTTPPEQAIELVTAQRDAIPLLKGVEHSACWLSVLILEDLPAYRKAIETFNAQLSPNSMGLVHCQVFAELGTPHVGAEKARALMGLKLFADEGWSKENADADKQTIMTNFVTLLAELLGVSVDQLVEQITFKHCHRWLYSRPMGSTCLPSTYANLGAGLMLAGDYFCGAMSGIESAIISGCEASLKVISENALETEASL